MSDLFSVEHSEKVFEGRVATVRIDDVVMPGGHTAKREVVEHDRAVAVVVLDTARGDEEDPDIVLISQYRHPVRRRLWELPAGLMDHDGEDPLMAAQRELAEEVGLAALDWAILVDMVTSPGFSTEGVRVYLAQGISSVDRSEINDEEADLEIVRIPLSYAIDSVFRGEIVNGIAVAGILAAGQALREGRVLRDAADKWSAGEATVFSGESVQAAPSLRALPT